MTTSLTVAEVADSQEQQQQQSKSNGAVSRRVAGQNVALSNGNGTSNVGRVTPRSHMEQEKRMRREIANSNERRRMQSINAGFQSLRTLLPHHEGEKLSKVSAGHCSFSYEFLVPSHPCTESVSRRFVPLEFHRESSKFGTILAIREDQVQDLLG